MTAQLRLLDTGLNPARWNVAMTAALVDLHDSGEIPDTLRFHRSPPSVLLGRHQNLRRAVNVSQCQRKRIEVARRITGGVASYTGPGILAFDLVVARSDFSAHLSNSIAWVTTGVAAGIARMGLPARFQPSGSIVIDRRHVGSITATYDALTLIFQGFIHVDVEAREMSDVLVAPGGFAGAGATAGLAAFLGRTPSAEEIIDIVAAGLCDELRRPLAKSEASTTEVALANRFLAHQAGTDFFIAGTTPHPQGATLGARQRARGGYVEAHVRLTPGTERRIDQIWIAGDFSIAPAYALHDLEEALRGVPAETAADLARDVLRENDARLFGATPIDIAIVIAAALRPRPARGPRSS